MTIKSYSFDEAMKDSIAKKSLQSMLLQNEEMTTKLFSLLQSQHDIPLDKVIDAIMKNPLIKDKTNVTLDELAQFTITMLGHVFYHMDEHQLRTYHLLELISLNTIQLNHNLNELVVTLAAGQTKNQRLRKMARNIRADEAEFKKQLAIIKKSMRLTGWWARRLDELKKGDPNERI